MRFQIEDLHSLHSCLSLIDRLIGDVWNFCEIFFQTYVLWSILFEYGLTYVLTSCVCCNVYCRYVECYFFSGFP
jgi:hypothetical protein